MNLAKVLPHRAVLALLVGAQAGIVVTGGAVRLTGSGLGCPSWPHCSGASFVPAPHPASGQIHTWIEFGNRMLTFVLFVAILLAVIVAIDQARAADDLQHAKRLKQLAAVQILGIFAQIVLGGISVLTKLNPFAVGSHFLLSISLIWASLLLRQAVLNEPMVNLTPVSQLVGRGLMALTAIVITLGVLVTGSGPHAGDITAKRFHLDVRQIAWLHADSVIALLAMSLVTYLFIRQFEPEPARATAKHRLAIFLAIAFGQGAIGYTQYFTGVPEILVGMHMLGATLVWISITQFAISANIWAGSKV